MDWRLLCYKKKRLNGNTQAKMWRNHTEAKMSEENKSPNPIYIFPDLLEEIFLRLPLRPILKFKTVSKQWRSILESDMFAERRRNVKQRRKILAAYNCNCGSRPSLLPEPQFEGDEEIIYLHCDARRPSSTCNGLVCFPEPDCITVLNPSTGQNLRFPSGTEPVSSRFRNGSDIVMGFGRDRVTGSYKVAKMSVESMFGDCDVLDVESGEWKKLRRPHYVTSLERQSVCVNGSIYWLFSGEGLLHIGSGYHLLALDLHREEFHRVSAPDTLVTRDTKIVNLENRLAGAKITIPGPECILKICSMNVGEEIWSNTYAINLASVPASMFTPVAVSNQGNLVLYNDRKSLFKYCPQTYELRCLSSNGCLHVISPYLENLAPLRSKSAHHLGFDTRTSRCRSFSKRVKVGIVHIMFITLVGILGYLLMGSLSLAGLKTTATSTHKWCKEKNQRGTSKRGISRFELFFFSLCYCVIFCSSSIREFCLFFAFAIVLVVFNFK